MRLVLIAVLVGFAIWPWLAASEMPMSFIDAMNNAPQSDVVCVRNYETGATLTEAYRDAEHLDRDTQIRTMSVEDGAACGLEGGGFLEASINSNVIGKAHIAWQSVDPQADAHGRHALIGRSVEDLTGVFSIQKFIQLWGNSTPGEVSIDWLPCS